MISVSQNLHCNFGATREGTVSGQENLRLRFDCGGQMDRIWSLETIPSPKFRCIGDDLGGDFNDQHPLRIKQAVLGR